MNAIGGDAAMYGMLQYIKGAREALVDHRLYDLCTYYYRIALTSTLVNVNYKVTYQIHFRLLLVEIMTPRQLRS